MKFKDKIPDQSWVDPRVEIRSSEIAGKGSFAKETIDKGELVIRWGGGVIVPEQEFEQGWREGKYQPETAIHFDKDHMWVQLASDSDDTDPYLNHSCDPNLWFDGWSLVARRNIVAGEELTFDYATGETYPLKGACTCGASNCRRKITGKEWQDEEFRRTYAGHFNPYIQGLIDENH
ncbi:SET domain-containing protein-lysine N-methyltransferase [Candidatus Berkelbacteria bacterium]|nr:SET domain-containing protein-lysine N-methyltransferase [Candidatus Berkelbacteria bacterium]